MIIVVVSTPLGEVATVRERRGSPILWESVPCLLPEIARADAVAWINYEPTAPIELARHVDPENTTKLSQIIELVSTLRNDMLDREEYAEAGDLQEVLDLAATDSVDPGAVTPEVDATLQDIVKMMDEGTSADGWDIGILEDIDTYLRKRGYVTVDCGDL
jgi:hypothetical protein